MEPREPSVVSAQDLLRWSEALSGIARTGLGFTQSLYEQERFEEVLKVAADIRVAEAKKVLLVPTAALRFDPATASPAQAAAKRTFVQSLTPMPPRRAAGNGKGNDTGEKLPIGTGRLFILRDGQPQPVQVKLGLSDGRYTEVSAEGLAEGAPVILRLNSPTS